MGDAWAWEWCNRLDKLVGRVALDFCWWREVQVSDVSDVGLTSSWGEGGCIFIGAVTQVVIRVVVVAVDVLKKIPVGFGGAVGVFWYDG